MLEIGLGDMTKISRIAIRQGISSEHEMHHDLTANKTFIPYFNLIFIYEKNKQMENTTERRNKICKNVIYLLVTFIAK